MDRIDNLCVRFFEFEVKISFSLYGFVGYFEIVFYKDVMLSEYILLNIVILVWEMCSFILFVI